MPLQLFKKARPRKRPGAFSQRALLSLLLLAPIAAANEDQDQGPSTYDSTEKSFVVIMVDDLDVGSFEQLLDGGRLPQIEQHLVQPGTVFHQSFVTNSLCCPSRATFLTGQYAHNHGVQNVTGPNGGYSAFHPGGMHRETLGTWLQAAGYYTALIGKYKNGYNAPRPAPQGWSYWRALPNHRLTPGSYDFVREDGTTERPLLYQTRAVEEKAVEVIQTVPATQPLFLFLAPTAPHVETLGNWNHDGCNHLPHPNFTGTLQPDLGDFDGNGTLEGYGDKIYEEYGCSTPGVGADGCLRAADGSPLPDFDLPSLGKDSFDNFKAVPQVVMDKWESLACGGNLTELRRLHSERQESMLSIDVMVGRVVEALASANRLDDTVLIFTSDNGYFLGEHRLGNKGLAYDESVRVPLIVRSPGGIFSSLDLMVANVDLAPTLLDYAGLDWRDPSYAIDGRSFRPHLDSLPKQALPWRKSLLLEAEHPRGHDLTGEQSWWIFPDYHAVRTEPLSEAMISDLTYISYDDDLWPDYYEEFLFDNKRDPHQVINRAEDPNYSWFLSILRSLHDGLADCAGEGCRSIEESWTAPD